jgi:excisionase family DNA binding protein
MEDLLTIAETALYLRVSESTVRRMVKDGRIPATQIGRQWRIPRAALEETIQRGGTDSPAQKRGE